MANGSFAVSTSNGYIKGTVTWSSTEDVANNQSTVTATMKLSRTNTGYTTYGSGSFTLNIGGNSDTESKSFTITYNSNTTMVTHSAVIKHNSDGKKSITISWSGSSDVFSVTSGSGTAVLDTIPRASSLTSSANWTAGSNLGVSISRADSSFVHSVYVYVNGVLIDNKGNIGTSTTFSWTTAENTEIFNQLNTGATQDTKILVITYEYSGGSEVGRKEYTGTVTAPAASTITSGTDKYVYVDQDISIGISRQHSSFYHTLQIYSGTTLIKTIYNVTTSTNFTFTQAERDAIYATTPNSNSVDGKIIVTTYYNGEKVRGSTETDYDFAVRNSNPVFPSGNVHYEDVNTTTTAVTGNNQYIIQNKSSLRVYVDTAATAQNKATIDRYEITVAGVTKTITTTGYTTIGAINATSNQALTVKAIDSRGNSATVTKTVLVVPYSSPAINSKATRLNNFENDTTLSMNGSISSLTVAGTQKNSVTSGSVEYRYKSADTTTWGAWTDFTYTTSGTTYTATNKVLVLDNLKAWNIEVRVSDRLETRTLSLFVNTGQPLLFLDDALKSVGVNKFPSLAGYLEVGGSVRAGNGGNYNELGVERVLNSSVYRMLLGTGYANSLAATYLALVKDGVTTNSVRINENNTVDFGSNILDTSGTLRAKKVGINGGDSYTNWQGGISYLAIANETGYPASYGILLSVVDSPYRNFQLFYPKNSQAMYMRTWSDADNNWTSWRRIAGEPDFIQASLETGWARYSNWALPGFYKDNDGFVHIQGMVVNGAKGSTIFTLPSGYAPRTSHGNHIFAMANAYKNGSSPYNMDYARIYVYTDGRVVWVEGGNSVWLSLSGISFFAG